MRANPYSVFLLGVILLFGSKAYAAPGMSEINNELFDKAHLKNIEQPGKLKYEYSKTSFVDGDRADSIEVIVKNIRNTGRADTYFEFFTGPNKRPYQERLDQRGNSVFVLFLEFDVHEMKRLTGGEWRYFQRLIRWSFAEGAEKKQVEVDYNGDKVKAWQYTIQPYIKDPKNDRYKLYSSKYYIFTLSEQIPGEIYEIKTVVPDCKSWKEGDPVLVEEKVTFTGFEPE